MIKAILFDFTGVLRTDALEEWLARHNLKKDDRLYSLSGQQDLGEISNAEFYKRISKIYGYEMAPEINSHGKLNFELISYINDLKNHYKVGLLSNSPLGFVRPILKDNHLEQLFNEVTISSEVHLIKPDPKIYELSLAKLNVLKQEALFIDDNAKHVEAANQLGIKSLRYTALDKLKDDLKSLGIIT